MKPGFSGTFLMLETQHELRSVEVGIPVAELDGSDFATRLHEAGFEAEYQDPRVYDGGMPPVERRVRHPQFAIHGENLDAVRASLDATLSLGGLAGFVNAVKGRKHTARQILENLPLE